MWNDTDVPLGYLVTFRSYGTWLHGDPRGSVNHFRNRYGSARLPSEQKWVKTNRERLKGERVVLNASQRRCVEEAVRETCEIRKWTLYAPQRKNESYPCRGFDRGSQTGNCSECF